MVRASTYVDVDVELDDFDEEDIIEHLERLGYQVEDIKSDNSDRVRIQKLYSDWLTLSPERFETELKKFFGDVLNINVL